MLMCTVANAEVIETSLDNSAAEKTEKTNKKKEEYKLREEALVDEEFMEFFDKALTDDVEDMKELFINLSPYYKK